MNGRVDRKFSLLMEVYQVNDVFAVITGVVEHAYLIGAFTAVICIPGTMIIKALHAKSPI